MVKTIYKTAVIEKLFLTSSVIELRTTKPEGFSFVAGQFVQLHVPDNSTTTLRSYSISSKPDSPYLEYCIKLLPQGKGSAFVQTLKNDDTVIFEGPQGKFVIPEGMRDIYFVATGVGIAPMISMLTYELEHKKNTSSIHLLFGLRHEVDIFWLERLETLARDYKNFSYTITLSQPSTTWGGSTGRVTTHLPEEIKKHHFFVCGSLPMVKDVRSLLVSRGADVRSIHFEIF